MASAGFDSSERGDHMTMMTGTAWEVDMSIAEVLPHPSW